MGVVEDHEEQDSMLLIIVLSNLTLPRNLPIILL